jgi:O-antigen ligase
MPHPETIRLLLVIAAFVVLVGMFRRPFYGVISYLIIMITRPGLYYPLLGRLRVELLIGILIIIVMSFSPHRLKRIQVTTDPICKWMFILFGVMTISMIQAFDFKTSWDRMYEFSRVFLFFLMIVALIDTKRDVELFFWVFGALTCLLAYEATYNYAHGIVGTSTGGFVEYGIASKGMAAGHVALANLTLQGMPVLWYMGLSNKAKSLKMIGGFLFLICLYGVVISGSRGGFVGLIALGICLTAFSNHRLLMILGGILFFVCLPLFSQKGYMDHMGSIIGLSDVSASSRIIGLRHGLEMLIREPLLGVGPGCYPVARKAWFHWGLWSHNHFGQLIGELGLLGTFVWFVFLKNYLWKAWHYIRLPGIDVDTKNIFYAIVVGTLVRLVLGMGSHSLYVFFWYMLAGIVIVLNRVCTSDPEQEG